MGLFMARSGVFGHCVRRQLAAGVTLLLVASASLLVLGSAGPAAASAVRPECPESMVDAAGAVAQATACGHEVEILSERTETTQIFAKPDSRRMARMYTGPVRVRDQAGIWRDIDLTLERRADGSIAPRVHKHGLVLSGQAAAAGDHELAVIGSGAEQVALGWRGPLPEPVLSGSTATWLDAKPGVDLVVEVTTSGFESFLLVKDRAAVAQLDLVRMPVHGTGVGLTVRAAASHTGEVELFDDKGVARVRVGAVAMWDAKVNRTSGEPTHRTRANLAVESSPAGDAEVRLTPDKAFLNDPATQYPVTIDPSIIFMQPKFDTFIESDYPWDVNYGSTQLRMGSYNGGGVVARSYLRWDNSPTFYGTYIQSATLWLYNFCSTSCDDTWWQMWITGYVDHTTSDHLA